MSTPIIISGFKGGQPTSLFDPLEKQTYQTAKDLNTFAYPNILTPHISLDTDQTTTLTLDKIQLSSSIGAKDGKYYFTGFDNSAGTTPNLWQASTIGSTSALTAVDTGGHSGATAGFSGIVEFLQNLFYYDQYNAAMRKYNLTSASEVIASGLSHFIPMFVHDGLKKMIYAVSPNTLRAATTTSPTIAGDTPLTLNSDLIMTNFTSFTSFVAIGVNSLSQFRNSKIFIWNSSDTTLADMWDIGDFGLQAIANVEGTIYAITSTNPNGAGLQNKIRVYECGSTCSVMRAEIDCVPTLLNSVTVNPAAVSVEGNLLHFGINGIGSGAMSIDNGVWTFDASNNTIKLDRIMSDTSAINVTSVKTIAGKMFVTWYDGTDYQFNHTNGLASILGIYQSNMFFIDPYRKGKVKRVIIQHKPLPSSCGFKVTVRHFGDYDKNGTPTTPETFATATVYKTFNTQNSTISILESPSLRMCQAAQIQIEFNDVNGLSAPEIIFPIIVEREVTEQP